jgi:hypothetical protein
MCFRLAPKNVGCGDAPRHSGEFCIALLIAMSSKSLVATAGSGAVVGLYRLSQLLERCTGMMPRSLVALPTGSTAGRSHFMTWGEPQKVHMSEGGAGRRILQSCAAVPNCLEGIKESTA